MDKPQKTFMELARAAADRALVLEAVDKGGRTGAIEQFGKLFNTVVAAEMEAAKIPAMPYYTAINAFRTPGLTGGPVTGFDVSMGGEVTQVRLEPGVYTSFAVGEVGSGASDREIEFRISTVPSGSLWFWMDSSGVRWENEEICNWLLGKLIKRQ